MSRVNEKFKGERIKSRWMRFKVVLNGKDWGLEGRQQRLRMHLEECAVYLFEVDNAMQIL